MTTIVSEHGVRDAHVVVPNPGSPRQEAARLSFDRGLEHVDLRAGAEPEALLTGRFGEPLPVVWAAGQNVHIAYPIGSRLLRRVGPNAVRVNPAVPWALDVHGGASRLEADLTGIDLHSVAFHSGAADVRIALGHPGGPRRIRLASVSNLTIERPARVPVRLEIAGGAADVALDNRRYGAVGNGLADQSEGYHPDAPHYLVTVAAGAHALTITGVD
ncbi:MAG: hypothetical protein GEV12_22410 [Micromonosporaceae bacterium]|nr:hypothetical protein [Micromonosporaceae bacterium]